MRPFPLLMTLATVSCLISGCQKGSDDQSASAPPASDVATAQESSSGVEALSLSSSIATDAIVSAGAGQTVAASDSSGTSPVKSVESTDGSPDPDGFSFSVSGNVLVDLDAIGTSGIDRFPNCTGTFNVVYDSSGNGGPIVGSPVGTAGIVAYDVTVTAVSDCTFTDPRCNASTTLTAGSSYTYSMEITWNWTDANQWTVQSDVDLAASGLSGSGSRPGVTWSATLNGSRRAITGLTYNAGTLTITRTLTADWTIGTMRNGTAHSVIWDRPELNKIFLTVDGTTYGPYTVGQLWTTWNLNCR